MNAKSLAAVVIGGMTGLLLLAGTAGAATASAATPVGDTSAAIHAVRLTVASQVVVVNATATGVTDATVTALAWNGDRWVTELGPFSGHLGSNGFTDHPHENDSFTPIGEYVLTQVFGTAANPGTAMPYNVVTEDDHWVDDPMSPLYNTMQHGDPNGRWSSAENLSSYEYAAAFDFNQNPVVPSDNSAIFLHAGDGPTAGCIAVDERALLEILRWLDPTAAPVIVLGVDAAPPPHPLTEEQPPRTAAGAVHPTTTTSASAPPPAPATTPQMPATSPETTVAPPTSPETTVAPPTAPSRQVALQNAAPVAHRTPLRPPEDRANPLIAATAAGLATAGGRLRRRRPSHCSGSRRADESRRRLPALSS